MRPLASWLRWIGIGLVALAASMTAVAGEPTLDVDVWHAAHDLGAADQVPRRLGLGLYPAVSGVLGAPNVVSWEASAYLSFMDSRSVSLYVGYGEEHGSGSDAEIYTLGLGGVRPLPSAAPQRGFHGKFVRYRRWSHDRHGLHHGLSVGTENGVGHVGMVLEVGAARSDRNHWIVTAQVAVKIALPVWIPLGGD